MELSESPAAPANDTSVWSIGDFLAWTAPLLQYRSPGGTPRLGSSFPGPDGPPGHCRTGNRSQFPPGLLGVGVGLQVNILVLHRPPQPLHEDIVGIPTFPVHADLHSVVLEDLGELPAGELAPPCLRRGRLWSVLNTSGLPLSIASDRASTQKPTSRACPRPRSGVLGRRQDTTYRLCQSMMATR